MSQDGSTFQTHRNHIIPSYPKEPVVFPYLRQYHSTPSLINNPDSEPYQDTFSQSTPYDFETPFDSFQSQTSIKNTSHDFLPKHQNLSHSTSLDDHLGDTSDSFDSDFEMLPTPIGHSNFSNTSFPQLNVHVSNSPTILSFPQQIREPYPFILELLILQII